MFLVGPGQGLGGSVIRCLFFLRCGLFFLEVVFFPRSQSLHSDSNSESDSRQWTVDYNGDPRVNSGVTVTVDSDRVGTA